MKRCIAATKHGLPPPETLEAFAQQSTDEVRTKARRYAESRLPLLRRTGRSFPKNYASELVADALSATWLGEAPWSPASCSLLMHIRGLILARTWNEIRRGKRFRHLSLDAPSGSPALLEEVEHSLAHASVGDCGPILLCALTLRVCSELRRIADGDADAQAILACWEAGLLERDEVMGRTGMMANAYKAARQRLLRLSKQVHADLYEAAHDLLRSAS
jgi:hypothetical protein